MSWIVLRRCTSRCVQINGSPNFSTPLYTSIHSKIYSWISLHAWSMNFKLGVEIFLVPWCWCMYLLRKYIYIDTQDIICNHTEHATNGTKIICTEVRKKVMASLNLFKSDFLGVPIYSHPLIIWNGIIVYLQNEHQGVRGVRTHTQAPLPVFIYICLPFGVSEKRMKRGMPHDRIELDWANRPTFPTNSHLTHYRGTRLSQQAHLAY